LLISGGKKKKGKMNLVVKDAHPNSTSLVFFTRARRREKDITIGKRRGEERTGGESVLPLLCVGAKDTRSRKEKKGKGSPGKWGNIKDAVFSLLNSTSKPPRRREGGRKIEGKKS